MLQTMAQPIVFRCPQTGMNVQHWLADAPEGAKDSHSAAICPACAKTHFIHNTTGKLLGDRVRGRAVSPPLSFQHLKTGVHHRLLHRRGNEIAAAKAALRGVEGEILRDHVAHS
jgi:hypothetical protein